MTQESLFPDSAEMVAAQIDSEILRLLLGGDDGTRGLKLVVGERAVLSAIRYHNGVQKAVPLREIAAACQLDVREVKQAVRTLRMDFRLPIGSSKNSQGGGYFLMVTEADCAVWAKDVLDQVRAEFAVLRAAAGQKVALEMAGQIRNDLLSEVQA